MAYMRNMMKKAIKVLEKRIEVLNREYEKKSDDLDSCEMACDHEFLSCDLANIELEIMELQKAIQTLNNVVIGKPQKCQCKRAKFTRTVDADFNPLCGRCGNPILKKTP